MSGVILVVEDNEDVRHFVEQVLTRGGYEVECASDGVVAVEKLSENDFDAMVLDLMMPRMDGFGVLRYLASTHSPMVAKTVVATAYPRDAAKSELHDICRVIVKPFDASRLLEAVRECVAA